MNPPGRQAGTVVRLARQASGMTLAQLGERTGYSASQVSRYERGVAAMTDTDVLRRFAAALDLTPEIFGLLPETRQPDRRHDRLTAQAQAGQPTTVTGQAQAEDDPVRRRQLLANLAVTAAAAAGFGALGGQASAQASHVSAGDSLITGIRDAMLGLGPSPGPVPVVDLRRALATALADFHNCRYVRLAQAIPHLIRTGHTTTTESGKIPSLPACSPTPTSSRPGC